MNPKSLCTFLSPDFSRVIRRDSFFFLSPSSSVWPLHIFSIFATGDQDVEKGPAVGECSGDIPKKFSHREIIHSAIASLLPMKLLMNLLELRIGHMRVNLRRTQVLMPQHFLHRAQIRPIAQQIRREAVAERVW